MANELRTSISLEFTKDALVREWPRKTVTATVVGQNLSWQRQTLSVAAEALIINEVISTGLWLFANRSTTAGEIIYLRAGAAGANMVALNPGEECMFRWVWAGGGGDLPFAIAALGTPVLEYLAIDP